MGATQVKIHPFESVKKCCQIFINIMMVNLKLYLSNKPTSLKHCIHVTEKLSNTAMHVVHERERSKRSLGVGEVTRGKGGRVVQIPSFWSVTHTVPSFSCFFGTLFLSVCSLSASSVCQLFIGLFICKPLM